MPTIKACKDCRTFHVERIPLGAVVTCDCYDGAPDSGPQKTGLGPNVSAALVAFEEARAEIEGDE